MEKEALRKLLFLNLFELLMEQGLLSEAESDWLKVMLDGQN